MKFKLTLFFSLACSGFLFAQQEQLTFTHQNIDFSAAPRTSINPMSIKLWDNYNNNTGPSLYGTVMEIYGLSSHQTSQLYFGGWDNSKIKYREAFYAQNTWSDWMTLLDSKNNVESSGQLMITGPGNNYITGGNVGIGTTNPQAMLDVNGAAIINGPAGVTLTLKKSTNNIPAMAFQGANQVVVIEGGDDYLTAYLGGARRFSILSNGNVGIGTINPQDKLTVAGNIGAREIKVSTNAGADFVFEPSYKLTDLAELEKFIKTNKHLPEIPTAKQMVENGINLGELNVKLLQKVEELTLYLIEKDKQLQNDASLIKNQQMQIDELKKGYLEIKKYYPKLKN